MIELADAVIAIKKPNGRIKLNQLFHPAGAGAGYSMMIAVPGEDARLIRREVQAVLRQTNLELMGTSLRVGDIELDHYTRRVLRASREVHLSPTEFRLLEFLMASPGHVFLREEIRAGFWSHDVDVNDRTIGVHMGRLRKALRLRRQFDPIRTVRGFGYAFKEEQNFNPGRAGKTQ